MNIEQLKRQLEAMGYIVTYKSSTANDTDTTQTLMVKK